MKRVVLLLLGVSALAAGPATAGPTVGTIAFFRTPSKNIGCVYSAAEAGRQAALRCDIRSGLHPKPVRPKGCDLDYGDSYEVGKTGRTIVVCHGDTAIDPHAPVLAYGNVWRRNGFACSSRTTGLRCTNTSGHGFFLSREHSYRF